VYGVDEDSAVDFLVDVRPILETHCVSCHNREVMPGRPSLESAELARETGAIGTYIVPGNPGASLVLYLGTLPEVEMMAMPPMPHPRLGDEEIATLRLWIEGGAPWPGGREGKLKVPAPRLQ
jgi:mono/diheme cytochrome c family protein